MSAIAVPSSDSWGALKPHDAVVVLSALGAPWWIAGGWALDLFLGKVTRAHKDLDVGIFRKDAAIVVAALTGWDFFEAKDGVLTQLVQGHAPRADVNSLWCKRVNAAQWELELMLDGTHGELWAFRRNARITRPLSRSIRRNADGIAYLAPEIQLLYKARATRARDQADFHQVLPHLDPGEKTWLRKSLMCMDPEHGWISLLEEAM
jgi:hypothetical protein